MMVILEEKLEGEGKWAWVWGKVAQKLQKRRTGPQQTRAPHFRKAGCKSSTGKRALTPLNTHEKDPDIPSNEGQTAPQQTSGYSKA